MMEKNLNKISQILKFILRKFYYFSSFISYGFYTIIEKIYLIYVKLFHRGKQNVNEERIDKFKRRKNQPEYLFLYVFCIIIIFTTCNLIYKRPAKITEYNPYAGLLEDTNTPSNSDVKVGESNLYKQYENLKLEEVNFSDLKSLNADVCGFLKINGTVINYPIVKTSNNDFYLNHLLDQSLNNEGWIFVDYRMNIDDLPRNLLIYGHELSDNYGFGGLGELFDKKWRDKDNHELVLLTETKKYTYQIFSAYHMKEELYYAPTSFSSGQDFLNFANMVMTRSEVRLKMDFAPDDKILTISTLENGENGKIVVHAKLLAEENK